MAIKRRQRSTIAERRDIGHRARRLPDTVLPKRHCHYQQAIIEDNATIGRKRGFINTPKSSIYATTLLSPKGFVTPLPLCHFIS
jgi:hypothetical protein